MGSIDEQIRERLWQDDEALHSAYAHAAGIVMGQKITRILEDERTQTKNAIGEILKYYHVRVQDLPDEISSFQDQLDYLMRPAGIMYRTVRLKEGWQRDAIGAMLLVRRDSKSPVALIPGKWSGYTYEDGGSGKRSG